MDMCIGMVLLAIPLLAVQQFSASTFQLGLLGSFGSLSYAICCPFAGRMADRVGYKTMTVAACGAFAGTYLLMIRTQNIGQMLILVPIGSAGMGMFWPSIQAWMACDRDRSTLMKTMGGFNVAWSMGLLMGPLATGWLYEWNPLYPFYFAVGYIVCLGAYILLLAPQTANAYRPDSNQQEMVKAQGIAQGISFLKIAWVANFGAWFVVGTIRNLFPKLGLHLGLEPRTIGQLMAMVYLAQVLGFVVLRRSHRWHGRMFPLASCQLLAILGAILIYLSTSPWIFGCAFALIGISLSMTYYASLFYSVYAQEKKGAKAGLHESILASGGVFGALLGGLTAQHFGLKSPYLLCVALLVVAVVTQIAMSRGRGFLMPR